LWAAFLTVMVTLICGTPKVGWFFRNAEVLSLVPVRVVRIRGRSSIAATEQLGGNIDRDWQPDGLGIELSIDRPAMDVPRTTLGPLAFQPGKIAIGFFGTHGPNVWIIVGIGLIADVHFYLL
jgi:hypothetical protein